MHKDAAQEMIIAFRPACELFAAVIVKRTVGIRGAVNSELMHTVYGHTERILSLDFSPTRPILGNSGRDSTVQLWNVASAVLLASLRAPGPYAGMDITDITGITEAPKAALEALGAIESIVERKANETIDKPTPATRFMETNNSMQ